MSSIRLLLCAVLGLGLVGCGDEAEADRDNGADNEETGDGNEADGDSNPDSGPKGFRDAASDKPRADDAGRGSSDAGPKPQTDAGGIDAGTGASSDGGMSPSSMGGTPGVTVSKTATVSGAQRTYLLYIPKGLSKATAVPFVSVHHGFTMTGKIMEDITSWKQIADREGLVVAFPDGTAGSPWNVGPGVCGPGSAVSAPATQDDFGFVKTIIDTADGEQKIARDKVFVAGFSMGGYFANHAACKGDFVRAASAHSGGTYTGTCQKPVPMLIIHGDADTLIPDSCGTQARDLWVTRNGCSKEVTTENIKMGKCEWNKDCPANAALGKCTLMGMDHGWAGAKFTGPWLTLQYGGGEQFENAAEMMWKFFAKTL